MSGMRLSLAASAVNGMLHGADVEFASVGIDSRRLKAGDLYVAIKGERHDGHSFVRDAAAQGAVAALVSAKQDVALPQIVVTDTRLAIGRLAAAWRARFDVPVIGVTGSNGKTTVKEMIAAILRRRGEVLVTEGNLNNDLGVPLTLFRLDERHRYAVIEMGANHQGEIAYVAAIARPAVGVITNAGSAHLEGFGGLDGVARGKGEMYAALPDDGIAVLNADDAYAAYWQGVIGARKTLRFGVTRGDVTPAPGSEHITGAPTPGIAFVLRTPQGEVPIRLQLLGRHNLVNACAAAAAALAVGAGLRDIQDGLAAMRAVKGRLQLMQIGERVRVIDDTYNANPSSLRAALHVLVGFPGRHVVVLGDMGELGEDAQTLHAAIGGEARAAGVHALYCTGVLTRHAATAYGADARHHATQSELIAALSQDVLHAEGELTVLVKGSRRAQMEKVVAALLDMKQKTHSAGAGED